MSAALCLAAFLGWGIAGYFASAASPGFGFLLGLAVGAGSFFFRKDT